MCFRHGVAHKKLGVKTNKNKSTNSRDELLSNEHSMLTTELLGVDNQRD